MLELHTELDWEHHIVEEVAPHMRPVVEADCHRDFAGEVVYCTPRVVEEVPHMLDSGEDIADIAALAVGIVEAEAVRNSVDRIEVAVHTHTAVARNLQCE